MRETLVVFLFTKFYIAFYSLGCLADACEVQTLRVASVPSDDDHVRWKAKALEDKRLYLVSWHFQASFFYITLYQETTWFVMWCLYYSAIAFHLSLFFHFYYPFSFSVSSASAYVHRLFISFLVSFSVLVYSRLYLFPRFYICLCELCLYWFGCHRVSSLNWTHVSGLRNTRFFV
jgi:hypothetical protein